MSSDHKSLNFVFVPFMAQGHLIPMVDMARLLSERGIVTTIVTTYHNAAKFKTIIDRAKESGHPIRLLQLRFPGAEVGLPEDCENLDSAPSPQVIRNFLLATKLLQQPLEVALQKEPPPLPSCIISDKYLPWTTKIAEKFKVPRIVFHGMGCFSLLCSYNILHYKSHERVTSDSEPFTIRGILDSVCITKSQLPGALIASTAPTEIDDIRREISDAETNAYGVVVNSCDELELSYANDYPKAVNKKVWCVGPVSQCNKKVLDMFERGDKASIEKDACLSWLDLQNPQSVIYVCLGSQCRLIPSQLIELGLGLEASNCPFIWVIKWTEKFWVLDKWLRDGFEERIKGRGLLIKGWAPQVLILSHTAIGGFLTHCGWNSTLEGICAGIPMITWPLFAEQFLNEKLIVQVMGIGIRVGADVPVRWGDEEKVGVKVKRQEIKKSINQLMDGIDKGERNRAKELGELARKSMETGSSYSNMTLLIQDIMLQVITK
ncbi:hypothetical protein ACHQM5_020380 [Ranunculus cassubicifolius]